jgi:hypothetical protein
LFSFQGGTPILEKSIYTWFCMKLLLQCGKQLLPRDLDVQVEIIRLKETLKPMVYGQINPQSRKIIEG